MRLGRSKLVQRLQVDDSTRSSERYLRHGRRGDRGESPTSPRPKPQQSLLWLIAFSIGGFTALCVIVAFHVLQSVRNGSLAIDNAELQQDSFYHRTLTFEVCNGMANQRLSVLYGIILAFELGRIPVLPRFLLSGVQWTDDNTVSNKNNTVSRVQCETSGGKH